MAAPRPANRIPFPDGTTVADFERDGGWDCDHSFDINSFDDELDKIVIGMNPDKDAQTVFDRVWTKDFLDENFDDWAAQAGLAGHPRAREAYDAWAAGWRECGLRHLRDSMAKIWDHRIYDASLFFVIDPETGDELERYEDLREALKVMERMPEARLDAIEDEYRPLDQNRILVGTLKDNKFTIPYKLPAHSFVGKELREFQARVSARDDVMVNPAFRMNPAWVTRTLAKTFETMEHGIPAKWLPKQDALGSRGATLTSRVDELGCGAYGCALPTLDPNIVLKVTTDETEAEFAEKLSKTLVVPVVTRYEAVMTTAIKHQGRPVTLLWREEAKDIGKIAGKSEDLVADQHAAAQDVYELIVSGNHGAELNAALDNWTEKLEAMKRSAELEWLARGMLKVFKEQGIGFFDVHGGNIGRCKRDGDLRWVISDPGHVAVVRR